MDCAFFPYGLKSKEFLIKRCIYLIEYLNKKCDKIIIACNTLSLLVLPIIKGYYDNLYGVFDYLATNINNNSIIIGSKTTIELIKIYYNNEVIDGTLLIDKIQKKEDYASIVERINNKLSGYDNIILACTHFLNLKENTFIIKEVKNK
jgi:glutamate racemase